MRDAAAANQATDIGVIIVTWNCSALLRACLSSLQRHAGAVHMELIIVDNASGDDSVEVARAAWPQAEIIVNERNLGFATACNQGMERSRAPLLCLLNPDTELTQPATLERVVQHFATHPLVDAIGAQLVFPDGRHQVGDAGHVPTLWTVLAHASGLSRWSDHVHGVFLQSVDPRSGPRRVGWVSGAFTVVRRSTLERAGGLDPSYFLYGEDVEWGCRMNSAGCSVWYLPALHILHVQGGTQKREHGPPSTRWVDGLSRLFYELHGGRGFARYRWTLSLGLWARAAIYALRGSPQARAMRAYALSAWRQRPGAWGNSSID